VAAADARPVRNQHASKDCVVMNDFITVFMFTDTAGNTIGEYQGRVLTGVVAIALAVCWLIYTGVVFAWKRKKQFLPQALLAIFLLSWGVMWLNPHYDIYSQLSNEFAKFQGIYQRQQYQVAEGVVHVRYQSRGAHDKGDLVTVGESEFEIFPVIGFGYMTEIVNGGVLSEGTYARVYYYKDESKEYFPITILRVDVKKTAG
jgi:hypothetical protein